MSEVLFNALVSGVLISLAAALIGTPLVLKRSSFLGDGLSHVAFGAFAIASALGFAPTAVTLFVVILASFLILRLGKSSKIHGDSAIALFMVGSLAIGTFVNAMVGAEADVDEYLFGDIMAISSVEMWAALGLILAVVTVYILCHNKIFAVTFDEKFARAIGINTGLYNAIFAVLSSVLIVLGMKLLGALLISGLIIIPTLIAQTIFKNFKSVTVTSAIISVIDFLMGLFVSQILTAPVGATVVIVNLIVLIIVKIIKAFKLKRFRL